MTRYAAPFSGRIQPREEPLRTDTVWERRPSRGPSRRNRGVRAAVRAVRCGAVPRVRISVPRHLFGLFDGIWALVARRTGPQSAINLSTRCDVKVRARTGVVFFRGGVTAGGHAWWYSARGNLGSDRPSERNVSFSALRLAESHVAHGILSRCAPSRSSRSWTHARARTPRRRNAALSATATLVWNRQNKALFPFIFRFGEPSDIIRLYLNNVAFHLA